MKQNNETPSIEWRGPGWYGLHDGVLYIVPGWTAPGDTHEMGDSVVTVYEAARFQGLGSPRYIERIA